MKHIIKFGQRWFSQKGFRTAQQLEVAREQQPAYSRHRNIIPLYDLDPKLGPQCFVAPNATIAGDVLVGSRCQFWYGCVVRGDLNAVKILDDVSIGERTVIHTSASLPTGMPAEVNIGTFVIIQNNCTLYSCTIGDNILIGQKSVILEGSKLEKGCAIGPNSVVPPGRIIPANQLWAGNPVQYIRDLEESEIYNFVHLAKLNGELQNFHQYQFLPYSNAYLLKENTEEDLKPKVIVATTSKHDHRNDDVTI